MKRVIPFRATNRIMLDKLADDFNAVRLSMLNGKLLYSCLRLRSMKSEGLTDVLNQQYKIEDGQVMTLLLEAAIHEEIEFMRELLDTYHVNVNGTGTVTKFIKPIEGVTALWMAAACGYLGTVKFLLKHGATVDFCTTTGSSPLRAACYSGCLEVVEVLIQHGADVNLNNIYNSTCLMIASYNSYKNIVQLLLKHEVDVNARTNCGSTALHFASHTKNEHIIKALVSGGAINSPDNKSVTPLLVAADRTHEFIVSYLIDVLDLTKEQQIDAYELLGSSLLCDKDDYDYHMGFLYLVKAMMMRKYNLLIKKPLEAIDAYNNQIESTTEQGLRSLKERPDILHYEALIMRERILGKNHPNLLQPIVYRGACLADAFQFKSCLKLWLHGVTISQKNNLSISEDILRFAQLFSRMFQQKIDIELSDFKYVLLAAINEIKENQRRLYHKIGDKTKAEKKLFGNMVSTLGLITIISETLEEQSNSQHPLKKELIDLIVVLVKMNPKTKKNRSLLHMAVNFSTCVDRMFTPEVYSYPHYLTMKMLIYCGANVNVIDIFRNTPLHYIGKYVRHFPNMPHAHNEFETNKIVVALLNAGAHTDIVNNFGENPHTGYLSDVFDLTNDSPRHLKCLAACALKCGNPRINYKNHLPPALIHFTNLH